MRIATTLKECRLEKYSRSISDDDAFNFIYLLEQGISIDAILDAIDPTRKRNAIKMLCRNKYLRSNALFCWLAGVKLIPLQNGKPINDCIKGVV